VPIAAIALDFDPILRLGDVTIRWQAVTLATTILLALVIAAVIARAARLRPDDLLFVVVGATPGAVIGGRLGYVLAHADFYAANPTAIVDPAQGSASLALAVAGGVLTGAIVARLLGTPIQPWLHVAALPVLLAIGLGKVAMALAGSGQGARTDAQWATSYPGPGPWGSLAPDLPAHPSQLYEAIVALAVAVALAALVGRGAANPVTGRLFLAGVAAWAVGRFAVGFTWRDPTILGPLRVEQLLTLAVVAGCLWLLAMLPAAVPQNRAGHRGGHDPEPSWPEPSSRPGF
jgi:phosphatidylglycerol---prolipoprotein diacylglyceryl transferase